MNIWTRRLTAVLACALFVSASACGDGSVTGPSAPTDTPASQRIIQLNGNLDFGSVPVGSTMTTTLTISNAGNATLTVSAIAAVGSGLSSVHVLQASWSHGTILPNASQQVTIRFTPAAAQVYSGSLVVLTDATSGSNTMPISATGASK